MRNNLDERGKDIFDLTLKLLNIKSVSNTKGVTEVGDFIYDYLNQLSYYQDNPEYLKKFPLASDDSLGRNNIVALIKGEKAKNNKTIMYISHMDTVDTGEYGDLEEYCCKPEKLMKKLSKRKLNSEVRTELESGEWLFGRGAADMKSGAAIEMQLIKEFSQKVEEISGNVLIVITVNEEADSLGMLNVAGPIAEMAEKEGLDFIGGINTDFVSQLAEDDYDNRYMFMGSLGKVVEAVYVVGKGSHVGQVFQGFDVNLLLSKLTEKIDNNMELADNFKGMVTNPPVSLKQADLKDEYNGQLPYQGFAYYNFLNYKRGTEEIVNVMKNKVEESFIESVEHINEQYRKYCNLANEEYNAVELESRVFTYGELFEYVSNKYDPDTLKQELEIAHKKAREDTMDLRIHSLRIVQKLWNLSELAGPAAVVFLVPPYYPPHNPVIGDKKMKEFNDKIETIIEEENKNADSYNLVKKDFFPYLSDACFTVYQEGENDRKSLERNMPYWGRGWKINIDAVKKLNIPVIDMGVHGKDAHKFLERLHVPYAFNTLPTLVERATFKLLED